MQSFVFLDPKKNDIQISQIKKRILVIYNMVIRLQFVYDTLNNKKGLPHITLSI